MKISRSYGILKKIIRGNRKEISFMKRQWSMVGAIVLFLAIAFLSVLNVDPVPINFGFATVEWPLIIVIFGSVLLGALIATLLSTVKVYRDQRKDKTRDSQTRLGRKTRSGRRGSDSTVDESDEL
jgi:uncharacterized integral membrane protein